MMLYVEWCDPGCKQVGLKSCVVSIDYWDYMGSSSKIWALRCLFLYLCSYNLVGSVTPSIPRGENTTREGPAAVRGGSATVEWRPERERERGFCGGESGGSGTRRFWPERESAGQDACQKEPHRLLFCKNTPRMNILQSIRTCIKTWQKGL
jgi:hypothetical protein